MIAPKQIGVSVSIAQKFFSRRHTELNKFETGSGSPGSVPCRYRAGRSSVGVAPQARTALSDPFWTRCTCNHREILCALGQGGPVGCNNCEVFDGQRKLLKILILAAVPQRPQT